MEEKLEVLSELIGEEQSGAEISFGTESAIFFQSDMQ